MYTLLVFDLDGTLVDSQKDLADATNALVEALGGERLHEARITEMVGDGAAVLVKRALTAAALDPDSPGALDRFLSLYDQRLLAHTVPYDGMVDALDRLQAAGRLLAVLTNKPGHAAQRVLEGLNLAQYFRAVIGGDSPLGRKPDPSGLFHLLASTGTPAEQAMLIGDSPVDLETARRAGVQACLARYGFGFRFQDSDFRGDELFVDRPEELTGLIG